MIGEEDDVVDNSDGVMRLMMWRVMGWREMDL